MKHLKSLLAALILGALALAGAPPAAAVSSPDLDRGDVTVFDIVLDEGLPALQVRDATGLASRSIEQREPENVVLHENGTGALDLAWSTQGLPNRGDTVIGLQLWAEGPGHVQIAAGGDDGLYQIWDSAEASDDPLVLDVPTSSDVLWSFTETGRYEITAVPSWYTDDGAIRGQAATYTVEVQAAQSGVSERQVTAQAEEGVESDFGAHLENPDAEIVDDGHFDFGVQVDGEELLSRVKDDRPMPAVWRDPDELLFRLDEPARQTVPDNEDFAFLGEPGDEYWRVGQRQEIGVPWLGWNTQHPTAREHIDGDTTWTLDEVEGPGELFVFQTGSMGELIELLGTTEDWPDELVIPPNVHAHGSWAFTEPGVYQVHTIHEATLNSGETVTSEGTLTFLVGEPPNQPEDPLDEDRLRSEEELTEDNRGDVTVSPTEVEVGDRLSVRVPDAEAGSWLMPVVYSEPQQTAWAFSFGPGVLSSPVAVPEVEDGEHKLAVYDAEGELAGWAPFTVTGSDDDTPPPGDDDDPPPGGDGNGRDNGGGDRPDAGDRVPPPADRPDAVDRVPSPLGGGTARTTVTDPCVDVGRSGGNGGSSGRGGGSGGSGGGAGGGGPSGPAQTVTEGHFDFGAIIEGGSLVPRVKDDRPNPPEWVHPESFVFALGSAAEMQVPDNASYSFLGDPGDTIWLIPETQIPDVPWLGWNTQHETMRSNVDGQVTFTLDSVEGPRGGQMMIYLGDSFGGVGERFLGSAGGFPTSARVPLNVHRHGNWAFTEPGSYRVTITQSATVNSGETVSAAGTLVFEVGGGGTAPSSLSTRQSGGIVPAIHALARQQNVILQDNGEEGPRLRADLPDPDSADDADGDGDGDEGGNGGGGSGGGGGGDATSLDDCLPQTGASDDMAQLVLYSVLLLCAGVAVVAASMRRTFHPVA